jgi:predicted lipoprotein with Yx(FWY)xxD motif
MTRYVAVGAVASGLVALSAGVTAAQAQSPATNRATVVKVAARHGFGRLVVTIHGRALYTAPPSGCTGGCLTIWPPLLMPRGKTIPLGTHCLGTARFGHRLQVTYREHRLYLFYLDSGTSVSGDEMGGFEVARAVSSACPA